MRPVAENSCPKATKNFRVTLGEALILLQERILRRLSLFVDDCRCHTIEPARWYLVTLWVKLETAFWDTKTHFRATWGYIRMPDFLECWGIYVSCSYLGRRVDCSDTYLFLFT